MENKARKMFAAVVVIMLCAVAIVGVGYAYTASTKNSGNNVVSEHVVLSQAENAYTLTSPLEVMDRSFQNKSKGKSVPARIPLS